MAVKSNEILGVRGLTVDFDSRNSHHRVLEDIHLSLRAGETLGLIGEGGSGKSLIAWSILGLPPRKSRVASGGVFFQERNILAGSEPEVERLRGRELALIVQNARAHLNPLLRVGDQIINVYMAHHRVSRDQARAKALETLRAVSIPDPVQRMRAYPHELSGGMAQRILIAMATISEPSILIADEPTMGLDVTIQVQILDLLKAQTQRLNASMLLITRDLGIAANYCNRIAVLYGGRIIETSDVFAFFDAPDHPYSEALLRAADLDLAGGDVADPSLHSERVYSRPAHPDGARASRRLCDGPSEADVAG
ncbi:MAG: ABC transporter ATP-binding protein [Nitrospiraceae bacterium]|nr:ABC transporter ATP-binding protein [Nitrospiraceae bacterium]